MLIVGAGPAGLTAAITLARAGVETLVVERRTQVSDLPRATGVSTATMELLRSWGLEEQVRAAAVDVEWQALATNSLAEAAVGHAGRGRLPDPRPERGPQPDPPRVHPPGRARADPRGAPRHAARGPPAPRRRGDRRRQPRRRRRGRGPRRRRRPHDPRPLPDRRRRRAQHRAQRARDRDAAARGHLATSMAVRFRAPLWDVVGEHRHVIYFLPGNHAALPVGHGDRWLYARPWDPERERLDDLTAERPHARGPASPPASRTSSRGSRASRPPTTASRSPTASASAARS